jgi:hypothetical protein
LSSAVILLTKGAFIPNGEPVIAIRVGEKGSKGSKGSKDWQSDWQRKFTNCQEQRLQLHLGESSADAGAGTESKGHVREGMRLLGRWELGVAPQPSLGDVLLRPQELLFVDRYHWMAGDEIVLTTEQIVFSDFVDRTSP